MHIPEAEPVRADESLQRRLTSCPVCGSEEVAYALRISNRRLDQCAKCGLLFMNPQINDLELSEIYRQGYLLCDEIGESKERLTFCKRASARLLLDLICNYKGWKDGNGKSLIDIGCGTGFLIAEADSMGFEPSGVAISQELLDKASVHAKSASLHCGLIEGLDLPGNSFDVCILSDTLEHVRDPVAVMRAVWNILKPDGVVLVATPSLDSFSARIMKDKWIELKEEHLFYFNSANLQTLLYKTGFSCISMAPHRKVLYLEYLKAHFDRYPFDSIIFFNIAKCLDWVPKFIGRIPFKVTGSGMVAIATKGPHPTDRLSKISIIVPVYNEKNTFSTLMALLLEKEVPGLEMEIVIVESNSTDGTREEVLRLRDEPKVRVVLQDVARGKGNAVREGLQHASGDIILIQDGDLEYDLWDYEPLIKPILQHGASFTLGLRHRRGAFKMRRFTKKPFLAWIINFGHKMLTFIFNTMYRQHLIDPWTMFKVFRKDCINGVRFHCDRFDFDIELVIRLVKRGFIPLEIPVNYISRSFAEGKKVSFLKDPIKILAAMLRFRFDGVINRMRIKKSK